MSLSISAKQKEHCCVLVLQVTILGVCRSYPLPECSALFCSVHKSSCTCSEDVSPESCFLQGLLADAHTTDWEQSRHTALLPGTFISFQQSPGHGSSCIREVSLGVAAQINFSCMNFFNSSKSPYKLLVPTTCYSNELRFLSFIWLLNSFMNHSKKQKL